ncbi:unnamed protein product [Leptosia nina]|uniref:Pre-C2HC domain-containing protein n=1 Tax=Leptosia nina TaxID=320188 RepID=A0AAV1K500_9NEOP
MRRHVQQVFHPSLFNSRPRSSSLGKIPYEGGHDTNVPTIKPCPPDWQRVPTMSSSKRKKMSESPPPSTIPVTNRYSELPIDPTDDTHQSLEKRQSKPPPIVLYRVEDINKLAELLNTVTSRENFTFRIVNKTQMRVNCPDPDVYKKVIQVIRVNGLIGHSFNTKQDRCYRIVIRNLHHTTPHEAIKDEIEKTGNVVSGEIINSKYGPEKKSTSTFFVNLQPGPQNKAVKEIKYIYNQVVVIEDPKKRNTIVQCQRCQQYGHTKNYCMRPYRCVKCKEPHKTSECAKRDRNTPAQCVLCDGPHPANYKGCRVYQEIAARKTNQQIGRNKYKPKIDTQVGEPRTPGANLATREKWSYLEALKSNQAAEEHNTFTKPSTANSRLEDLLLKQAEKFDIILQQMSTLMGLIVTLVNKLQN